jgi:uncharacterized protein (TIGR02594 family)
MLVVRFSVAALALALAAVIYPGAAAAHKAHHGRALARGASHHARPIIAPAANVAASRGRTDVMPRKPARPVWLPLGGRIEFGIGGNLINIARSHLGATAAQLGLPRHLWCADFMNRVVLPAAGYRGTGSRQARSFAHYGHRLPGPQVGAIAVLRRGRGGHVGVVTGIDASGDPIIISGNHGRRVGEGVYPRGRVIAYVAPS